MGEGVHLAIQTSSEKKSQFLCDFVTGNPILAGILGVIIDDPKTHFAALKLKKQGKSSYSYEVRNINVLGNRKGRNQEYMFVNSSQYKRTNGNFHIQAISLFNIETIEAVTDDIKTGLCRVLLTFNRIGGGSKWGDCPRYLLLDREGIKFMRWLLIKQALEGNYILDEPSLVTKQRQKLEIKTNKGCMAAPNTTCIKCNGKGKTGLTKRFSKCKACDGTGKVTCNTPLEALVFDPRLQAVLLLVLDARKKLNADQAEKNRDIGQKEAAYKKIVEAQTARLKKWERTVADACANQNLDESIRKLLALDIGNGISGLGCLGRSRSNSWSLSTSIGCFQDLPPPYAAASFKKRNNEQDMRRMTLDGESSAAWVTVQTAHNVIQRPNMPIEDNWYYHMRPQGIQGPVKRSEIMELKLKNEIDDATFVWHQTATTGTRKDGWTKYGSVKCLTAGVGAAASFKKRNRLPLVPGKTSTTGRMSGKDNTTSKKPSGGEIPSLQQKKNKQRKPAKIWTLRGDLLHHPFIPNKTLNSYDEIPL